MSRTATNFLVDAVAFAALVLLGTTGAITRYVLPPGSGHFQTLWGIDRHDWGGIHFWISIVFVIALIVHLFLHWRWIVATTKGSPQSRSRLRSILACMVLLLIVGLAIAPFISPVAESGEQPPHKGRVEETASPTPHVNGSMTLEEIEQQTGVPSAVILKELGLPPDTPTNERMGRLRKQYDFEMHKVQEIVEKHLQQP